MHQIEDPSAFGVVQLNERSEIVDFVEKPQTFVSDLAMIGIYYFKKGEDLLHEIEYLLENKVIKSGEYQLPDALRRLVESGNVFKPGAVEEWLDCGNKAVTVHTNQRVLEYDKEKNKLTLDESVTLIDSIVIQPCYIAKNVTLKNAIVGPHVSIGEGSILTNTNISNSIVQTNTKITNKLIKDSLIGSFVSYEGVISNVSLGDYSTLA